MPEALPAFQGHYNPSEDLSQIIYGPGALERLPAEVAARGSRALLVTSPSIAAKTDLVQRVQALLGPSLVAVFSETIPHTPRGAVLQAAALARSARPGVVLSLGGGSVTDTAKALRLALWAGIEVEADYDQAFRRMRADPSWTDGASDVLPQIGMPTTLISAEHTQGMGITNPATHGKQVFNHPGLLTHVILLDPALTVFTPPPLWFSTGIKALEHAIAKLSAPERDPVMDAIAAQAVRLLGSELRRSHADPADLAARGNLLVAAWLCMFGSWSNLIKRMGLSHALGRQTGGVSGASHGMISAVLLPRCIEFNAPVSGAGLLAAAQALDVSAAAMTGPEAAAAVAATVRALVVELGLPSRLRDIGVTPDHLPRIAERTMQDMSIGANPRPVRGAAEVLALLEAAW